MIEESVSRSSFDSIKFSFFIFGLGFLLLLIACYCWYLPYSQRWEEAEAIRKNLAQGGYHSEYVRIQERFDGYYQTAKWLGISAGALIMFGGAILFSRKSKLNSDNCGSTGSRLHTGVKSLDQEAYKIFLVNKYGINKNLALDGIVCVDRLFDSIESALQYADELEKPKVKNAVVHLVQPDVADATCPNCDSSINSNDECCWRCSASFMEGSDWQPILNS